MAVTSDEVAGWAGAIASMEQQWIRDALRAEREMLVRWNRDIAALEREHDRLLRERSWLRGAVDWLGVLSQERREMTHSRLLAGLCDPTGQHGLATVFPGQFLSLVRGPECDLTPARVALEVTGRSGSTRADVVHPAPGTHRRHREQGRRPRRCRPVLCARPGSSPAGPPGPADAAGLTADHGRPERPPLGRRALGRRGTHRRAGAAAGGRTRPPHRGGVLSHPEAGVRVRDRVDSAPLRFYFEHRDRIEEWAALRGDADAYTRQLLHEIGSEFSVEGALSTRRPR